MMISQALPGNLDSYDTLLNHICLDPQSKVIAPLSDRFALWSDGKAEWMVGRGDVSRSTSTQSSFISATTWLACTATQQRAASPAVKQRRIVVGNRVAAVSVQDRKPYAQSSRRVQKGDQISFRGALRLDCAGGWAKTPATRRRPQNSSQVPEDAPKPLATFFVGNLLSITGSGRFAGAAIVRAMPRKAVD